MKNIRLTNNVLKTKYMIIMSIMLVSFFYIIFSLVRISFYEKEKYENLLSVKTSKVYTGQTAQRGKIYDRNGVLLVGNKEVLTIMYRKTNNKEELLSSAKRLSEKLEIDYSSVTEEILKDYFYINNRDKIILTINERIIDKYKNREISDNEFENIIKGKISGYITMNMSEEDKKAAYMYYLMDKGYRYEDSLIKENISEEEKNVINEFLNDGFYIGKKYERVYPFGDTLRSIFGNVGPIRKEEIEYYTKLGYNINSIVGVSYLEKQYDGFLKGQNETYKIDAYGKRIKVSDVTNGNDIYLTIDINLQKEIEGIIENGLVYAHKQANTEFYNKAYSIIGDYYSGEVKAMVAKEIIFNGKEYSFVNREELLISDAVTPGSSVKGASHIVGYDTGAISFGKKVVDGCIYIKNTPKKCSWKSLGLIDDITALKYSSNYYQFLIAISVGKGNYRPNHGLILDKEGFSIYRKTFNQFGLGVKTGIDLPYESVGFIGNDLNTGSILDFPIGQYDTYTPIQMFQYISTIANTGQRVAPHLLKEVRNGEEVIFSYEREVLNTVNTKKEFLERVQLGFKAVLERGGTGVGYMNLKYEPFGKTGTAQSFIDTNSDSVIDSETISTSFVGYAKNTAFVVLSPNVSSLKTNYYSSVNKRMSRQITDLYFEKYH